MAAFLSLGISPETSAAAMQPQNQHSYTADDYQIVPDTVENGVRTIIAIPSPLVCTKKIVVKADENRVIRSVTFTRGCNGNLKAIDILLRGMTVEQTIAKLEGNMCGNRGTSCTDQLCRILKKAYGIQ